MQKLKGQCNIYMYAYRSLFENEYFFTTAADYN